MTAPVSDMSWSEALDQFAASIPAKPPLQRDPRLWQLLARDRAEAPHHSVALGRPHRKDVAIVDDGCAVCGKEMRPHHTRLADYPHTVQRGAAGKCMSCYQQTRRKNQRRLREGSAA
ncbi:hypothetical protein LZP97_25645 [Rhodococcus sp. DMF-1]|uniref:hypothetical protein n=1 Tax=Rhodococcus TaxID=1827 RepID=UPI000ABDA419|nr:MULTISPECIES: hypothetical protein [Rhodococcus]UIR36921.1 hypothetical protein LZP97_25645 [Rhodococcus sp. DMF-1]